MSDDLLLALGRCQRADLEVEHELTELDERSRPFDAGERDELLDAVFGQLEGGSELDSEAEVEAETESSAEVIPLAPRGRFALIASVLAAAAAAMLVWWAWPGAGPEQGPVASVPTYTFTQLDGGIAGKRSKPAKGELGQGVPELALYVDSNINWVLTPAKPSKGPVAVALLARSDAGAVEFVAPLEVEVGDSGAVRLRGSLADHVDLAVGAWTLTLLLASPGELPSAATEVAELGPWRSLTVRVIIVARE